MAMRHLRKPDFTLPVDAADRQFGISGWSSDDATTSALSETENSEGVGNLSRFVAYHINRLVLLEIGLNDKGKDLDAGRNEIRTGSIETFFGNSPKRLLPWSTIEDKDAAADDRAAQEHNQTIQNDRDSGLSMELCIKALEPHLAAFRIACQQKSDSTAKVTGSGVGDKRDKVPPQILRLSRFFRWKFEPVRKALLRPPLQSEIEIGCTLRLRFARALHSHGVLAAAEIDVLEASFDRRGVDFEAEICDEKSDDGCSPKNLSRKRKRNDVSSRLQIAFSRLPMEVHNHNAATLALRHLRTVLIEYCNEMREKENSQSEEKANSAAELLEVDSHIDGRQRNKNLLSPNTVAQIALTAFAACVFSSGVDGYLPSTSRPESNTAISFESTLASLIGDTSERCKIPEITHAVQAAITQLMSSPLVDNMSSLHILSLARLLSHLDTWAVENIFARAILQCSSANSAGSFRGAGLTVVPKLFATYLSLLESHATKSVADISSMNYLLNNFFDRLRVLIDEEDNGKCIDPAKENADDGHLLVENLKVQTSSSHQDFLYVLKCTTSFLLKCE